GADGELVRWGQELTRVEARVGRAATAPEDRDAVEVALVRTASGGARKRIRVNGVSRRAAALTGVLRAVLFAPEEMLLVIGSPSPPRRRSGTGRRSSALTGTTWCSSSVGGPWPRSRRAASSGRRSSRSSWRSWTC